MVMINDVLTVERYQLYKEEGLRDWEILGEIGLSYNSNNSLTNWKKKNGLVTRKSSNRKNIPPKTVALDKNIDEVLQLKKDGATNQEIAKKYHMSETTFHRWLQTQPQLLDVFKRKTKITKELIRLAAEKGINEYTFKMRVYSYKWSIEKALNEPVDTRKRTGWR